jgi:hypothetical protein
MNERNPAVPEALTDDKRDTITEINVNLKNVITDINSLGRFRSSSLAVTKIQEAMHWLVHLDENGE